MSLRNPMIAGAWSAAMAFAFTEGLNPVFRGTMSLSSGLIVATVVGFGQMQYAQGRKDGRNG